ncbi:MAG TPA: hypothetical protein VJY34_13395 [Roseiarcus sp.]|nr:hypothetical protein [Roseiarcus sp.]
MAISALVDPGFAGGERLRRTFRRRNAPEFTDLGAKAAFVDLGVLCGEFDGGSIHHKGHEGPQSDLRRVCKGCPNRSGALP